MLGGKNVVLGVSGGIAAYKVADLASKLTQAGANVRVVMTESATEFVGPLTFRALTKNEVGTDMFASPSKPGISHILLGEEADVVVIAPATANIIAKIAAGIADDLLTCTVLATKAPVIIVPAMHACMYENTVTQENLNKLKARGFIIIDPEHGRLASGGIGPGRFPETDKIIGVIKQTLEKNDDLSGKTIVVTAGGTQEPIDPVRHIGNRSSGKMGYAIAKAARDRGATVSLITAPVSLPKPEGIQFIPVRTAAEMKSAVAEAVKQAHALIMAAAVADYQPKSMADNKIKKDSPVMTLEMVRTPDILGEVKGDFIRVGFAAESKNVTENARQKLQKKNLDLIVANDITGTDSGFDVDTNKVTLIDRNGKEEDLPLMSKREVADKILDRVVGIFASV